MTIINRQTISGQIILLMHERISSGQYGPGEKLPSESELSQELNVSRASVRTALSTLATAGLISRKQGDGTYVTEKTPGLTSITSSVWEFKHLISKEGKKCVIKGLKSIKRLPDDYERTLFALGPTDQVAVVKRLFFADERPIIYSINVLPIASLKADHDLEQLDFSKGLDDFVKENCNIKIIGAKVELSAVEGTQEIMEMFCLQEWIPLLRLVEIFHDKNNKPLILTNNYIRDFVLPLQILQPW